MMAAAEAALGRWARAEMELPPAAAPSGPVLRRLCLGPCAPIWEFVTRHVRHPRYRHLEESEGAGPALRGAVSRLRQELGGLGGALGGAQEAALQLEAALEAGLARREAELRRGAELRLLGEAAARDGRRLRAGREALRPPQPRGEAEPALAAAVAMGTEPEVLASVRAVCRIRAEALEALLEPRPLLETQERLRAANERWLRAAEALLGRVPPGSLLWALELLALESTREAEPGPASGPAPEPEAPPTVEALIQERWGAVGGLWGRLPPLAARLRPLRPRLARLGRELALRLGGRPPALRAARLALEAAALGGARGALLRGLRELRGRGGAAPPPGPPSPTRERRQRLRRQRHRLCRRQRRLRALGVATAALKAQLRPLQARVRGAAQAGLGGAPAALAGEGERLRRALGALGALGEAPPGPPPDPLLPVCRALGVPPYEGQQGALRRAAALRAELRELRRGAEPSEGAEPPWPRPPPPPEVGVANAELLPRLRLVAAQCRRRIEAWPRLQALVSQWWEQPAQWTLAPPPGSVPFSHWLQRWSRAARALAPPPPRPLSEAPPQRDPEGRDQGEPRP